MNRENKIARLQALLDRVQTRAKEGRAPRGPVVAPQAVTTSLGFDIAPVAMPTSEPFEAEETRPFAKMPTRPPEPLEVTQGPEQIAPEPLQEPDDGEVVIETSEVEIELDDVGEGGLEVVEEEQEAPISSRRPVDQAEPEFELELGETTARQTPPPESGPQKVSRLAGDDLEVDVAPKLPRTPEHPSIEMLGQTVELPDSARADLELDQKPVITPFRDRPTGEMEAVIPGSLAPGLFPPTESEAQDRGFGQEPLANDWVLPDEAPIHLVPDLSIEAPKVGDQLVPDINLDVPLAKPQDERAVPDLDEPLADKQEAQLAPDADTAVPTKKPEELDQPEEALAWGTSAEKDEPELFVPDELETARPAPSHIEVVERVVQVEVAEPTREVAEARPEPEPEPIVLSDESTSIPEPEAITRKPEDIDLQALAATDHAAAELKLEAEPAPEPPRPVPVAVPVTIEIAGQVVRAPDMNADDVAAFVGAIRAEEKRTFLELLDGSLDL